MTRSRGRGCCDQLWGGGVVTRSQGGGGGVVTRSMVAHLPPPPRVGQTDACEHITFARFTTQAIKRWPPKAAP